MRLIEFNVLTISCTAFYGALLQRQIHSIPYLFPEFSLDGDENIVSVKCAIAEVEREKRGIVHGHEFFDGELQ